MGTVAGFDLQRAGDPPSSCWGIVSKALATLLQEMLKSAVYIAIDLFAALLVGAVCGVYYLRF